MADAFHVALTADFYAADGSPKFADFGLDVFESEPRVRCAALPEMRPRLGPDQLAGVQGVVVLSPAVTAESVSSSDDLLAVGRFGVGYDAVDVAACTNADVLVFITKGAVDRPVAEATIAWMLALTHRVRAKDQLVRTGQWDDRVHYMGSELRDRTLGIVGLGGIGREIVALLGGFGMRPPLAYDPHLPPDVAASLGVRLVELDELMATADFVSINCPLMDETRGLIGARQLGRMKRDAYLIHTARGGIVDEDALYAVLAEKRIAGAAVDVFVGEPLDKPHRLGELDNVLLAPHCISWTHECFRDIGRAACQGMVDLAQGRPPKGVVNPAVLERPGFQAKWQRLRIDG